LDAAMLLGLALGVGVLTKQSGTFALTMVPLGLLVFDWSAHARGRRLARWIAYVVLAVAVCAVCYSVLMLSPDWRTYLHARNQFHRPIGEVLTHPFTPISKN